MISNVIPNFYTNKTKIALIGKVDWYVLKMREAYYSYDFLLKQK